MDFLVENIEVFLITVLSLTAVFIIYLLFATSKKTRLKKVENKVESNQNFIKIDEELHLEEENFLEEDEKYSYLKKEDFSDDSKRTFIKMSEKVKNGPKIIIRKEDLIFDKKEVKKQVIPYKPKQTTFNSNNLVVTPREMTQKEIEEQDELDIEVNTGLKEVYDYSFEARMHQATRISQERFSELKNYILSYPNVTIKKTWKYERFMYKGSPIVKIWLHGNSIKLYYNLNPKLVKDNKYRGEDLSRIKMHEKTPVFMSVENQEDLNHAKLLVALYFNGKEEKLATPTKDYTVKTVSKEDLINAGLIKVKTM